MTNKKNVNESEEQGFLDNLFNHKYKHLIFCGLIAVLISILFFRLGYLGYEPKSHDIQQWRGAAQVQLEYEKDEKEQALWNSNLFSGMPGYNIYYPAGFPFLKNILQTLFFFVNWAVLHLILAAIGVYVLMISLGFKPLTAFICGISFTLSCHFIGLIEIGHNTKYRAIVYIPWIVWAVNYLFKYRNLLGVGFVALFLTQQLRENHFQITYYTAMIIIFYWLFSLYQHKKEYGIKQFSISTLLLLTSLVIAVMAVAQPYLSIYEYAQYTIRGGDAGLSFDYATSWSFHPLEMLTFISPGIFGGIAPYYWGWMPFTQTSMYMGIIIFALALIAIIEWKSHIVKMLTITSAAALLLSFGRHIPILTNFLLNYLPLYNKFRVPSMILVVVQFSFVVMAGYGIKYILTKARNEKIFLKLFFIALAVIVLVIVLGETGILNHISFQHANDAGRYEPRQLEHLRQLRISIFTKSTISSFAFLALFSIGTWLFVKKKKLTYLYLIFIALLSVTDLMMVNKQHLQDLVKKSSLEDEFVETPADKFLLEDEEVFRIYPIGNEFGQSKWAYHHQSIGGYHGAKLKRYQDIIEYSMNAELQYKVPINWNVINMLNTKYLISPFQLPFDNLKFAYFDREKRVTVYENLEYLPRAWFTEEVETISEATAIFRKLNSPDFHPRTTAIIETEIADIESPVNSSVSLEDYSLHRLSFAVKSESNSLLTISEMYYPAGWNAYLNGKKIDIVPVNYILRGVVVPAGEHNLEMLFEPETYKYSVLLSFAGISLIVIFLLLGGYFYYKKNYNGELEFTIKGQ